MSALITDGQRLTAARGRFGHEIHVYDDGYGPLFIHRDSMGISGIVRAQTWEGAYSICEDELFPEASETIEELVKEYGFRRRHVKIIKPLNEPEREDRPEDYPRVARPAPDGRYNWEFVRWGTEDTPDPEAWMDNELFQESFGFRPSGPRAGNWTNGQPKDPIGHGIYVKDLNGDSLELLTPEMVKELEITLVIEEVE